MLAMHVIEPVIAMCVIGAAVGLLLRWRATRFLLAVVGVLLISGMLWAATSWAFLLLVAPSEARANWPDDLPILLKAIMISGLVALIPALLVGVIRIRRQTAATGE